MMLQLRNITLITLLLLISATEASAAESTDSVAPKRNIITRLIDYFAQANKPRDDGKFDISFIGGPHYSSDVKFGIGIVAAAHYGRAITDTVTGRRYHSESSLYADFTITGSVKVGIRGTHLFGNDDRRLTYDCFFLHEPWRFWGIGFDRGKMHDDYTKFTRLSVRLNGSYTFRLAPSVYLGPALDFAFVRSLKVRNHEIWGNLPRHTATLGVGALVMVDTRDNITAPTRGLYATGSALLYPSFVCYPKHLFAQFEASLSMYRRVWRGGILAGRLHGAATVGNAPWSMLPTFGGSSSMRGYFEGRFIDNNELDLTVELRQHVYRRSGAVVWVGAGTVFDHPRSLRFNHILPNAGVGYRWEFKKNSNVRVDIGFGRGEWGFVFNINEAF